MSSQGRYIAIDLETTGLDAVADRIVEIGAVAFDDDGRVVDAFEQLVDPGRPLGIQAQEVSGLRDSDLIGESRAAEVLPRMLAFLDRYPEARLLAHNSAFDAGFLGLEMTLAGIPIPERPIVDTLPLARSVLPELRSHRLEALLEHLAITPRVRHRALADAEVVKDLWMRLDGRSVPTASLIAYSIRDGSKPIRPPIGWERLEAALAELRRVRMSYTGGSRGETPRLVTPQRFAHRGGIPYLVATCHIDKVEKSFRLDRIQNYEILDPATTEMDEGWPGSLSA